MDKKGTTTTSRALMLINSGKFTKDELSKTLDISRPTLNKRLNDHKWKTPEKEMIKNV